MSNDKRYDVRKVLDYIDIIDSANLAYKNKKNNLLECYARYVDNDTYHGRAAEASKMFISEGETRFLEETVNLHTQIRDLYVHAQDSFSQKVDSANNARISIEVLDKVESDFCNICQDVNEIGKSVEDKVKEVRGRCGKYGYITQPSYEKAREGFREFCGGNNPGIGFLTDCKKKLIKYDAEECEYIDSTGIRDGITENRDRIRRASEALNAFHVHAYEIDDKYIDIEKVFNYDTGQFEDVPKDSTRERNALIKRIYGNLNRITDYFKERIEKDREHTYNPSFKDGAKQLAIWGQTIDEFLCRKIDGLFDGANDKKIIILNDGGMFGITRFVAGIQSLVNYGDISHTDEYVIENINYFYKGALKKLVHYGTGFFSIPQVTEDLGDFGVSYIVSMGNYLATHDPKDMPKNLDIYLNKEIDTSNAQIRLSVQENIEKMKTMEVKDWFGTAGSCSVDVAFLLVGAEADKKEKIGNEKTTRLLNSEYYKNNLGYDCSEIAEDFYKAAGGNGKIYRIEGNAGVINGYEYGYKEVYEYHEVFSDGQYIFDPRYKNAPVTKNEYFRALREINKDGFVVFERTLDD